MPIIEWVQGDILFPQEFKLRDPNNRVVDLTGFSEVRFYARIYGTVTAVITGTCNVSNEPQGEIYYTIKAGETDTAGKYEAEIEVTWGSGKILTFPNIVIIIKSQIGS